MCFIHHFFDKSAMNSLQLVKSSINAEKCVPAQKSQTDAKAWKNVKSWQWLVALMLGSRDAYQVYRMKSSVWISPWLEMKYLPWKLICHHFSSLNFWTLRAVREISTVATDIPVFPAEKREVLVKYWQNVMYGCSSLYTLNTFYSVISTHRVRQVT